ncbi:unnamed protein product [Durusdinium trenchii]|uniref:Uncharacterized protein n=1 Tax=Durusdinium trenchii TaxID=1381693 RepID=A0ABP0JVL2_9DINO
MPSLNWSEPTEHVELFAGDMAITKGEWKESRGSTLRSKKRPLGGNFESVRAANIMVARVCILLLIAQSKGVWWLLEQPIGSLMEKRPNFQALTRLPGVQIRRMATMMAWFGGATKKPTWLYSSHKEVDHINSLADKSLAGSAEKEMVVHYTDGKGKRRIKGGRDLKQSQAYPERFGRAVAKVRTRFSKVHRQQALKFLKRAKHGDADCRTKTHKLWVEGADLQSVFGYLGKR